MIAHICVTVPTSKNSLPIVPTMSSYRPVKYVIFDVDGLLLDTETLYVDTFNEVLGRYGAKYTDDVRLKVLGTVGCDICRIFIEQYKLPVSLEDLRAEVRTAYDKILLKTRLMPGAERLVIHLKKHNIPIAVATNSDNSRFSVKSKANEEIQKFFAQFHHIVIGGSDIEVKNGKPAPDVFLVCAARFAEKPSPNECLVLEDSPVGVKAAVAAGMQVVMVPDPMIPEEERKLATKVIPSLLEFKPEEFGLPSFTT